LLNEIVGIAKIAAIAKTARAFGALIYPIARFSQLFSQAI
jgi:hypothetical protein